MLLGEFDTGEGRCRIKQAMFRFAAECLIIEHFVQQYPNRKISKLTNCIPMK